VNRAKTILFLTATRADFGKLKPLIAKVSGCSSFDYRLFVTGMHMLSRYGSTVKEVENAGFKNIFTYINQDGALNSVMDLALANTIQGQGAAQARGDLSGLDRGESFQPLERHPLAHASKSNLNNEPGNRTRPRVSIGRAELDAALSLRSGEVLDLDSKSD
jgi:hypothetical protein